MQDFLGNELEEGDFVAHIGRRNTINLYRIVDVERDHVIVAKVSKWRNGVRSKFKSSRLLAKVVAPPQEYLDMATEHGALV